MLRIWVVCAASSLVVAAAERWTSIGPFGGAAEVVALHAIDSSRLYLLSKNSLLYRSDDGGAWWNAVRWPGQQHGHGHALAIDPLNRDVVFAALASTQSAVYGAYKSTDGGLTWKPLTQLGREVFSLAIHPTDSRVIAAGVRTGVFLSRDGGESWSRISPANNAELQPVMSLGFDARSTDVIYAGTPHLPWKTADGGKTWTSIHRGMHDDSDILALTVNRANPDQVIIGACSGIYRSDNGAAMWRKLMGITGAGFRTYSVAQDPTNPNVIFSGTRDGLWRSPDGGKTWRKLAPNIVKSIAISADAKKLYLASEDAGVLISKDGGATFQPVQNGFADMRFHRMTSTATGIFIQTPKGLSIGGGKANPQLWRKHPAIPANGTLIDLIETGGKSVAVSPSGMWTSTGKAWVALPAPPGLIVGAAPAGKDLLAATARGLFRRSAKGTWHASTLPANAGVPVRFEGQSNRLALETSNAMLVSTNGARSWNRMPTLPIASQDIYRIAVAGDTVLLATSRGLYRSTPNAWQICDRGLQPATVNAIAVHPSEHGAVYAAQFGKIFQSTDAGRSWSELQTEELAGASVVGLSIPGDRSQLLALTAARGVFVRDLSATSTPAASNLQ